MFETDVVQLAYAALKTVIFLGLLVLQLSGVYADLKETVPREFSLQVLFMDHFPPGP